MHETKYIFIGMVSSFYHAQGKRMPGVKKQYQESEIHQNRSIFSDVCSEASGFWQGIY